MGKGLWTTGKLGRLADEVVWVDGLASVLLVTGRRVLADAVSPVAAALGLTVSVRPDVESAGPEWLDSTVVLLGEDVAGLGVPVRRRGVVVVALSPVPQGVWRTAMEIGAERVTALPDDREWLLHWLVDCTDPGTRPGMAIGVLGGRGGAGASTLSACLAVTSAADRPTMLVDVDPWGGGVHPLLGAPGRLTGLRWNDLDGLRGPVRAGTLQQALPRVGDVSVLSWDGGRPVEPRPDAVESVLQAGRRHFGLVVVDLPRAATPSYLAALAQLDVVLLLVPCEVRATVSAGTLLPTLRSLVTDVRLVVRGPSPGGLAAEQVAQALGLPLQARIRPERGLAAALERGDLPSGRGPLRRFCSELLSRLDACVGGVAESSPEPWEVSA